MRRDRLSERRNRVLDVPGGNLVPGRCGDNHQEKAMSSQINWYYFRKG